MTTTEFEELVRDALTRIPSGILRHLENVDVVVEDRATDSQLLGSGIPACRQLLGLYEGIPLPNRYDYDMILPDKITLFKNAIEDICSNDDEVIKEIRLTLIHEIAHHFGMEDSELEELAL